MKRWITVLMLALLLCALAMPAAADTIAAPDNSFFRRHQKECAFVNKTYYANGPVGYILAHTAPLSRSGTPLPNGQAFWVSHIYQNRWGIILFQPGSSEHWFESNGEQAVYGWVDLNYMVADYDAVSFAADHALEIVETNLELDTRLLTAVACYKYPGSGIVVDRPNASRIGSNGNAFTAQFIDPAGRTWGYVPKSYYHRDAWWICLDAPNDASLPPDENCVEIVQHGEAPKLGAVGKVIELNPAADEATLRSVAKAHSGARPFVIACAVGMVIVAAAVLIATLRRKEGGKTK